jgi:TPR repeat protein
VKKDETVAARFYHKGCDGGEADSCNNLGYAYAMGNGVIKDEERAAELYQKACDVGQRLGCDNYWSLQKDRSNERIVKFKGGLYRIRGPLSLSLPSGGSVTMEYIKYVGRELMVSVPKAGSSFVVGPINVTPLGVDKTPAGETQQLECFRQAWNSKTQRLELIYRRNQLNISIDILPVGLAGFIITKVVFLSQ